MCIKEGLRLHCPVAILGRETTRDFTLGDRVFPEGTQLQVFCVIFRVCPEFQFNIFCANDKLESSKKMTTYKMIFFSVVGFYL